MNDIKPFFYTVQEVCEILKVHENTVYQWLLNGKLKAVKFGRGWRIPADQLNGVGKTDVS